MILVLTNPYLLKTTNIDYNIFKLFLHKYTIYKLINLYDIII